MTKPIRLITNRKFVDEKSVEWIEIDERGIFFWKTEDFSFHYFYSELYSEEHSVVSSFPVTLEFVREMFKNNGRELDVSRLPKNYVVNPYIEWI